MKRKIKLLLGLGCFFVLHASSQNCMNELNNIYKIVYDAPENKMESYAILKNGKLLYYDKVKNTDKIIVQELFVLLTNKFIKNTDTLLLDKDSLSCGKYWVEYLEEDIDYTRRLIKNVTSINLIYSNGIIEFWGNNPISNWNVIKTLPPNVETRLREECKKKNIDIDYFLGPPKKQTVINTPKSRIYTTPNVPTKMYLIKGDPVEVLEQKESWLKIRYYGKKTIEGWIKKEDVEK